MGLWVEQTVNTARKERLTKLGPIRDAAPEIARIKAEARAEHPGNEDAASRAFDAKAMDMMQGWGPNDQTYNMTRDAALVWAKEHIAHVRVCASEFRWKLACYSDEDFVSEAVVSALEAADISNRKGEPFEAIFWFFYQYRLEHLCNNSQIAEQFFEDADGNREDNRLGSMDTAPDIQLEKAGREMFHSGPQCKLFINQATCTMKAEEADAWILCMSDSRPSTREIGDRLKLSRQGAEYRIKQGWRRVQQFYRDIGITGDADTGDITSGHKLLIGVEIEEVEVGDTAEKPPACM
jgi:hypothetical protein